MLIFAGRGDFNRRHTHIAERLGHEKVTTTLGTYSYLYPDKGQALASTLGNIKNRHDQEKKTAAACEDPPTPEPDF